MAVVGTDERNRHDSPPILTTAWATKRAKPSQLGEAKQGRSRRAGEKRNERRAGEQRSALRGGKQVTADAARAIDVVDDGHRGPSRAWALPYRRVSFVEWIRLPRAWAETPDRPTRPGTLTAKRESRYDRRQSDCASSRIRRPKWMSGEGAMKFRLVLVLSLALVIDGCGMRSHSSGSASSQSSRSSSHGSVASPSIASTAQHAQTGSTPSGIVKLDGCSVSDGGLLRIDVSFPVGTRVTRHLTDVGAVVATVTLLRASGTQVAAYQLSPGMDQGSLVSPTVTSGNGLAHLESSLPASDVGAVSTCQIRSVERVEAGGGATSLDSFDPEKLAVNSKATISAPGGSSTAAPSVSSLQAATDAQQKAWLAHDVSNYCKSFSTDALAAQFGNADPLDGCIRTYTPVKVDPTTSFRVKSVVLVSASPPCGKETQVLPAPGTPESSWQTQEEYWTIQDGAWRQVRSC